MSVFLRLTRLLRQLPSSTSQFTFISLPLMFSVQLKFGDSPSFSGDSYSVSTKSVKISIVFHHGGPLACIKISIIS